MVYATTAPEFKKTLRKILRFKSEAIKTGSKTANDRSSNNTNLIIS